MKAYIITDNDEYILGFALACTPAKAKKMALDHHPDPSSAEWTDMRARRVPCLDAEIGLFERLFLDPANIRDDSVIFERLRDIGIARIGWNDESQRETWLFDFKPKCKEKT